jgi:hypothetical protein
MDVEDVPREELARIAYQRGSDPALREAALRRLNELELQERQARLRLESPSAVQLPHFSIHEHRALGPLALAVLVLATLVSIGPLERSTSVLDSPQTMADMALEATGAAGPLGAVPGSVHILWSMDDRSVFAFLHPSGQVCVEVISAVFNTGSCVSRSTFESRGIESESRMRPVQEVVYTSVVWGPWGPARVYEEPLSQVG